MSSTSPPSSDRLHPAGLPSLSSTHPINGTVSPTSDNETTILGPGRKRLSNSSAPPADKKAHETAVRAAKAEIREKLREDWEWPFSETLSCLPLPLDSEEISWVERESDDELSPPPNPPDPNFPDDQSPECRKRKRYTVLHEEMSWNDGMRNFVQRRDAWTCARTQENPPFTDPFSPGLDQADDSDPTSQQPTTLLPIAPPLLPPSNVIRRSITPATYPSLYSKIVVRGLAPTVPVNLGDMTRAMVEGWKRDGDWPPKPGEPDGGASGRSTVGRNGSTGRRLARRSVGRVKKVLGLGHGEEEADVEGLGADGRV